MNRRMNFAIVAAIAAIGFAPNELSFGTTVDAPEPRVEFAFVADAGQPVSVTVDEAEGVRFAWRG